MNHFDRVLAVDIGTSSVWAMVFDSSGRVHAMSVVRYGLICPGPGMEEQDPDLVRRVVLETIGECLAMEDAKPEQVGAIAFSSQMYGVFPVDGTGKPLMNNILWSDSRADIQAQTIKEGDRADYLYRTTGCPVDSMYPLSNIRWIRETKSELFKKAARFVSIKEYVLETFAGEWVVDYSLASSTGYFDIAKAHWDDEALALAGISGHLLSRPVEAAEAIPFRNRSLLSQWKLPENVCLFSGGGDGPLANLGSGASKSGDINIDLGTSGAARVVTDKPLFDMASGLWCYCLTPGRWTVGGIITNARNAIQWLATTLGGGKSLEAELDALTSGAAEIALGAEGLILMPYLRKVRAPFWDGCLSGSILGIRPIHDRRHIARTLVEAIAFDAAEIVDAIERFSLFRGKIVLTRGLSKSSLVRRLFAGVLGREIDLPQNSEASVAGAALIALKGIDLIKDYVFDTGTKDIVKIVPDPEEVVVYRELWEKYRNTVALFRSPFFKAGGQIGLGGN
jgi:gluconokinase